MDALNIQLEMLLRRFGGAATITINDAAAYLGIDRRTLLNDNTFPVRKVGTQYRVPVVSLAIWLTR